MSVSQKKIWALPSNHVTSRRLLVALTILIAAYCILPTTNLSAQRTRGYSFGDLPFKERLWYGGSFILGFASGTFYNQFQIGLAPMVGYKLTPSWSIGPRVEGVYQYFKVDTGGDSEVVQPFIFTVSAFTRLKFLDTFFGHVEFGGRENKFPIVTPGGVQVVKQTEEVLFIGGGYNSGGRVSGDLSILFNVLEDPSSLDVPFYIRGGITVNF